jgi:hypothetical protein
LRSIEGSGGRHFLVTLDSRYAIRNDLVAALGKENGKFSPDTLLIRSWLFWLSHSLCRVVGLARCGLVAQILSLFEIARLLVRLDDVASIIFKRESQQPPARLKNFVLQILQLFGDPAPLAAG